jgi:hypothetical protein
MKQLDEKTIEQIIEQITRNVLVLIKEEQDRAASGNGNGNGALSAENFAR